VRCDPPFVTVTAHVVAAQGVNRDKKNIRVILSSFFNHYSIRGFKVILAELFFPM
jgi:hypothetical protein